MHMDKKLITENAEIDIEMETLFVNSVILRVSVFYFLIFDLKIRGFEW
jgi:hypothetical protein